MYQETYENDAFIDMCQSNIIMEAYTTDVEIAMNEYETTVAMEGIGDVLKSAGDKVRNASSKMWKKFKELLDWIIDKFKSFFGKKKNKSPEEKAAELVEKSGNNPDVKEALDKELKRLRIGMNTDQSELAIKARDEIEAFVDGANDMMKKYVKDYGDNAFKGEYQVGSQRTDSRKFDKYDKIMKDDGLTYSTTSDSGKTTYYKSNPASDLTNRIKAFNDKNPLTTVRKITSSEVDFSSNDQFREGSTLSAETASYIKELRQYVALSAGSSDEKGWKEIYAKVKQGKDIVESYKDAPPEFSKLISDYILCIKCINKMLKIPGTSSSAVPREGNGREYYA